MNEKKKENNHEIVCHCCFGTGIVDVFEICPYCDGTGFYEEYEEDDFDDEGEDEE